MAMLKFASSFLLRPVFGFWILNLKKTDTQTHWCVSLDWNFCRRWNDCAANECCETKVFRNNNFLFLFCRIALPNRMFRRRTHFPPRRCRMEQIHWLRFELCFHRFFSICFFDNNCARVSFPFSSSFATNFSSSFVVFCAVWVINIKKYVQVNTKSYLFTLLAKFFKRIFSFYTPNTVCCSALADIFFTVYK